MSGTPSGTPPSSPDPQRKRTREAPSSSSKSSGLSYDKQSKRRNVFDTRNSSHQRDSQSGEATNFSDRIGYSSREPKTSVNNEDFQRKKHIHKKSSQKVNVTNPSSEDDSTESSDSYRPKIQRKGKGNQHQEVSFIAKVKQHYDFDDLSEETDARFSRTARKVQKVVVQHMSDIKQAINAFNTCGARPTGFPSELTRDLLEYNFIDIELIYAYNLARKSRTKIYDSDEKSSSFSKIKPVQVNHFGHWQKIIETLRKAYTAAYRVAAEHFNLYFDDLLSFTQDMSETAEWDAI